MWPFCPYKPLSFQTLRHPQVLSNFQSPKFKFSVWGKKNVRLFEVMTKTSVLSEKTYLYLKLRFVSNNFWTKIPKSTQCAMIIWDDRISTKKRTEPCSGNAESGNVFLIQIWDSLQIKNSSQFQVKSNIAKWSNQHQEKNGALFWKRWVNVSLKWRNLSVVPTRPLDRSTITTGIWTNCNGLLASFRAWVKFRICPRITLICFSYSSN